MNNRAGAAALIRPSVAYEQEYLEMLEDWKANDGEHIPWFIALDPDGFAATVARLEGYSHGVGLGEEFVANSTYWLVDGSRKIIGVINIRHRLNEFMRNFGGHIGYGVRPCERRRGYAREMLRLGLATARQIGLARVLICCYKDNIGSARTIVAGGGVLDSEGVYEGKVLQRYWIELG